MTQEEKAKAYDEAIKKAAALYKASEPMSGCNVIIETLFPELKESEDEKIRKAIIEGLREMKSSFHTISSIKIDDAIAWLEKQEGCEYIKKDWLEHIKQSWYKEGFIDGKYSGGTSKEWTINDAATLKELIDFLENGTAKLQHDLTRYANWLKNQFTPIEKQGEKKASYTTIAETGNGGINALVTLPTEMKSAEESLGVDSKTYNKIVDECIFDEQNDSCVKDYNNIDPHFGKSIDKTESKFHEGEWITNGDYTWKIVEVKPLDYILQSQDGNVVDDTISHVDEQFHSFTIADAKDGDVLLFEGYYNSIVLFQGIGINGAGHINYHCKCDLGNYSFNIQGDVSYLGTIEKNAECFHPATKEQRDLLFQKMKEAGYAFDFEKKELKEIEQKSIDSYCQENCKGFQETGKCFVDGECKAKREAEQELTDLNEFINELSKQFPDISFAKLSRIVVRVAKWAKSNQPKQEWSEEDEEMLNSTISFVEHSAFTTIGKGKNNVIDWLKSLRPQNRWKPSDGDIIILEKVIKGELEPKIFQATLQGILEQLKKL